MCISIVSNLKKNTPSQSNITEWIKLLSVTLKGITLYICVDSCNSYRYTIFLNSCPLLIVILNNLLF